MNDFPGWFNDYSKEQLKECDDDGGCFTNDSLEELQIAYIKIWSVIEIFSKIIIILAEKRAHLKEIKPVLDNIKQYRSALDSYENSLIEIISHHESSIDGACTKQFDIKDVPVFNKTLKKISGKKFSVSKNVVFKPALPKKDDIDKAIKILDIYPPQFSDFLNAADKESKFYTTRNKIAHEGNIDIKKESFVKERLIPILQISRGIRDYINSLPAGKDSE